MIDVVDTLATPWTAADVRAAAQAPVDVDVFLERFAAVAGLTGRVVPASSASAGLEALVRSRLEPGRRLVAVCALNCGEVAVAVRRGGGTVALYDLASPDGQVDWVALGRALTPAHAVVVVSHLFGVPTDFGAILQSAAELGVIVVEDCAQTVGGTVGGRPVGTLADAAIFSFGLGKPVPLAAGGAVVLNDERLLAVSPRSGRPLSSTEEVWQLLRTRSCLDERAAAITAGDLAMIHSAGAEASRCGAGSGLGPVRARLGLAALAAHTASRDDRTRTAGAIAANGVHQCWHVGAGATPAWLRQKVVLPSLRAARSASASIRAAGVLSGPLSWPTPLVGGRPSPVAATCAARAIDVALPASDDWRVDRIVEVLSRAR